MWTIWCYIANCYEKWRVVGDYWNNLKDSIIIRLCVMDNDTVWGDRGCGGVCIGYMEMYILIR